MKKNLLLRSSVFTSRFAAGFFVIALCVAFQLCPFAGKSQTAYWLESVTPGVKKESIAAPPVSAASATLLTTPNVPMYIYTDNTNGVVYWSDAGTGSIRKVSAAGGGIATDVVTGITGTGVYPRGIYVDVANNVIYWAQTAPGVTDVIKKVSISSLPVAASSGTTVVSSIDIVRGIAADGLGNIYFADAGAGGSGKGIYRVAASGNVSEGSAVKVAVAATEPNAVVVDATNNVVYWSDFSASGNISKAATNASILPGTTTILYSGASIRGISVDVPSATMYWTEYPALAIKKGSIGNFSISNVTTVVNSIPAFPRNLSVPSGCSPTASSTSVTVCAAALPYVWNGQSFSTGGTYVVHLTNHGGCDSAATLVLTVDNFTATFTPVSTTKACHGGFIYAVAKGNGIAPYMFSLNGGAPVQKPSYHIYNLVAGTYTETVTDSAGCTANPGPITVTQAAAAITEVLKDSSYTCTSTTSAITATASGGWGGYLYSLNNGTPQASNVFVVNAPGIDSVRVTDSIGCTVIKGIVTGPLSASFAAPQTQICFGATITGTATATGGDAPYQYSLNSGASQASPTFTLSSGPYTVTVTDAKNCTVNTNTVTIAQPATAVGINLSHTDGTCKGKADGTITAQGTGGYGGAYMYSLNGGAYQSSGMFTGLGIAHYYVRAKDVSGCLSPNTQVFVSENPVTCPPAANPGGKNVAALQLKVNAYPNPSPNGFVLVVQGGNSKYKAEVTVRDVYGHPVYQTTGTIFDTYRFGNTFAGGVYLVEVHNGNLVQTVRLVKGK